MSDLPALGERKADSDSDVGQSQALRISSCYDYLLTGKREQPRRTVVGGKEAGQGVGGAFRLTSCESTVSAKKERFRFHTITSVKGERRLSMILISGNLLAIALPRTCS